MTHTPTPPSREVWQTALHRGLFPLVETPRLERLRSDLAAGSYRLCQGATTDPPPIHALRTAKCFAACLLGHCVWDEGDSCGAVDDAFMGLVAEMTERDVAEHGVEGRQKWAGQITLFWDHTPREQAFAEALAEVDAELVRRTSHDPALRRRCK